MTPPAGIPTSKWPTLECQRKAHTKCKGNVETAISTGWEQRLCGCDCHEQREGTP